nr:uncharacterized protein LOC117996076 [Maniola hyperantus]
MTFQEAAKMIGLANDKLRLYYQLIMQSVYEINAKILELLPEDPLHFYSIDEVVNGTKVIVVNTSPRLITVRKPGLSDDYLIPRILFKAPLNRKSYRNVPPSISITGKKWIPFLKQKIKSNNKALRARKDIIREASAFYSELYKSRMSLDQKIALMPSLGDSGKVPPILTREAKFRKGYSTSDHLHTMQQLIKKVQEYKQPLYIAFIDFTKTFDSNTYLWQVLERDGIPHKYNRLLKTCKSIVQQEYNLIS